MQIMKTRRYIFPVIAVMILLSVRPVPAQSRMSAVMDTATLQEQFDYIQKKTKIYDRFRAIREDYFQKIKGNALDSLEAAHQRIGELESTILRMQQTIDTLRRGTASLQEQLEEVTRTKNSLLFLGIRMNKTAYNALMWSIVTILAALVVILFLMYKRSHVVTARTRKELEELKEEFEQYRKNTRERIEKMTISHHREIQKLKGKQ